MTYGVQCIYVIMWIFKINKMEISNHALMRPLETCIAMNKDDMTKSQVDFSSR